MKTKELSHKELFAFLEEKYDKYNRVNFIETDPISIPHQFTRKEDIEVSAFLSATIAWGQRITIIKNCNKLMQWMDNSPYEFIMQASDKDLKPFSKFIHRTFNGIDCIYFLKSLKNIYTNHEGMEAVFSRELLHSKENSSKNAISHFRKVFFELKYPARTLKHISNPISNSSAKRLNMFLRWMVRKDKRGVDFGIWNISPSLLHCPLDVHSGSVARKLGILKRKQDDWKAVEELTNKLKQFDPNDPVKYDFALFGLGAFEKF